MTSMHAEKSNPSIKHVSKTKYQQETRPVCLNRSPTQALNMYLKENIDNKHDQYATQTLNMYLKENINKKHD